MSPVACALPCAALPLGRHQARPRPARLAVRASSTAGESNTERTGTRRTVLLGAGAVSAALAGFAASANADEFASPEALRVLNREGKEAHTKEEWRKILSAEQYSVLREEATERPWSSPLNQEKRTGAFTCAGCGSPLFASSAKYNSGTGWPSFYEALPGAVMEVPDYSIFFMPRTEVRCANCQGHLGHVFDDGPAPTNLRYCMNGLALQFKPSEA